MPKGKIPEVKFVRLNSYKELSHFFDEPFNTPTFTESFTEDDFEQEYLGIYNKMRERLSILGTICDFDESGIHFGPLSSSRAISITLDSEEVFRPEFLYALQALLISSNEEYAVCIDGEYAPGEGTFYIFVTKDRVLGYADDPSSLKPFGFL